MRYKTLHAVLEDHENSARIFLARLCLRACAEQLTSASSINCPSFRLSQSAVQLDTQSLVRSGNSIHFSSSALLFSAFMYKKINLKNFTITPPQLR